MLAAMAKTFVASAKRAVTNSYTPQDRTALAAAGVVATVGLVAGPVVAAATIVGAVYIGRSQRNDQ